jgi:hypothetical protein
VKKSGGEGDSAGRNAQGGWGVIAINADPESAAMPTPEEDDDKSGFEIATSR